MKEKHIGGVESKEIFYEEVEGFAREKIREHLQDLLEQEVSEWLGREKSERKVNILEQPGYRNGYGKKRRFTMSLGTMEIQRPRVRDLGERFKSKILPMFKRQSKQVRELIPELYLHGLASGDFELALRHLLGEGAPLSASSLQRLKEKWRGEYEQWKSTTIEEKDWAYLWADGIYVKAGLGKEKAALLVVIGVQKNGSKRFLALEPGYRESKESWAEVLRQLKTRGVQSARLFVGDGNLGLWAAVGEVYPQAVKTVVENWERLTQYYDFPRAHWKHLRTSNVVESPFSRVRLRTTASRRFKSQVNATCLIWKTLMIAELSFRKLDAPQLVDKVAHGQKYANGQEVRVAA